MRPVKPFHHLVGVVATRWVDLVRFLGSRLRSRTALAAESLFIRKQLALYRERQVKPRTGRRDMSNGTRDRDGLSSRSV